MAARNGSKTVSHAGDILLVVHDFIARSPDELSLAKGDRIELIERDDDFGDGWFLGRHMTNGNTGLFPEVYTTPAPKGTLNSPNIRRASEGPAKVAQDALPSIQQIRHASTGTIQQRHSSAVNNGSDVLPMVSTPVQPPAGSSASVQNNSLNSPVMNETLSVIDEHITDMSTPRQSYMTNGSKRDSSVYSGNRMSRISYIAGHETDEEESHLHTEEEVMQWSPERVAEYLEDQGVEKVHCEVFKEQEISGEVLLAMDQSSIFIKEFDLGPVGRRLKTWHKIKSLQDEIRRSDSTQPQSVSDYSAGDDASGEVVNRARSSTMGSALPRALSTASRQDTQQSARSSTLQPVNQASSGANNAISPLQSMTSMSRPESTYRPSAQTIRQMQHSRRHSSIDSRQSSILEPERSAHRKQPSLDQSWQPGQSTQTNGKLTARHSYALSTDSASHPARRDSNLAASSSPLDLEQGYHSSTEADRRSKGNVLHKKSMGSGPVSPVQSRANSMLFSRDRRSTQSGRITSPDEPVSPIVESPSSLGGFKFGNLRISSSPAVQQKQMKPTTESPSDPIVTRLDHNDRETPRVDTVSGSQSKGQESEASSTKATPSPSSSTFAFFKDKHKTPALRAISDAVTRKEKQMSPIAVDKASPTEKDTVGSPTKTGSTTPSTENRSFDLPKSDIQSRTSAGSSGNLLPPPQPGQRKPRPKTKKTTSAYTRGLEKKGPAEQTLGCDYSGWMKKKSGSMMATWKPRLFILRGRRLSYYYSDQDTEEKGLIDISFHRVLPAQDEKFTSLHATVTGAAGSGSGGGAMSNPTSPTAASVPTMAQQDLRDHPAPVGEVDDGLFIFKLVPPRTNLAKGIYFTKPTVHYFAVNSRQEGRLWMAALMKATIDRDENGQVTTTYNQKTISLAKARARRERPPALKEESNRAELEAEAQQSSDTGGEAVGLGIDSATVAAAIADESSTGTGTPATDEAAEAPVIRTG
ncbi:hypothetical protein K431DRAFT_274301 [Polychaeton citri CBS 116435]|uniref:Uncharacterized protein n=1 Tax=Polychaeton citri CBS 116435 TaxID=1314669 RepID=A0A9P4Q169_9PEZI|nr:hypothetical protein K431DRAFT_274301 [Polychaeton citri CBS 116435]